jgi:hypothetical protein
MANSLTVTLSAQLSDGTNKQTFSPPRYSVTPSAYNCHRTFWVVGTSAEAMPTGDVSSNRILFLKNLDATNYVTIGPDNAGSQVDMLKLFAGDIAMIPLKAGVTIKGTANTAAVKLELMLTDSTT